MYRPSDDGPVPAVSPDGAPVDPFDVLDRLGEEYSLVYVVDLDGVERAEPQLDLLQELARDATIWVDGGVRNADQAIDILVTGAQRAVLSSGLLREPRELRRAWRLSTELVFELELGPEGLVAASSWEERDPLALAQAVRELGPDHLVLSPREVAPDWDLVRKVSAGGPTWVDGSFERSDASHLPGSGARGGIFHSPELMPSAASSGKPITESARDDEA